MDDDITIIAFFAEQGGGGTGEVVYEETQTGGSSGSIEVSTAAPLTAVSGNLYVASVASKKNTEVTAVSGFGLSWTEVTTQCAGRNQTGVSVWVGEGTPSGDGIVTAMFATEPSNAMIAVSRYSGADGINPIGAVVSGNTNGELGSCSGGSDNGDYSFDLNVASNGAMVYAAAARRHKTHTPGAGYTERVDDGVGDGGSVAGLAVMDQAIPNASPVTVDGAFSGSVDWGVVAMEIRPASANTALGQVNGVLQLDDVLQSTLTTALPEEFSLQPNYPNPFNGETVIEYALPQTATVRLVVYNIVGQQVKVLVNGEQAAGFQRVKWNGKDNNNLDVSSGVYFLRFNAGGNVFVRRMVYQK